MRRHAVNIGAGICVVSSGPVLISVEYGPMELLSQRDIEFLLYEWLDVESLTTRPRFSDHDRTSFDAIIDTARRIASDHFLPIRRQCDLQQPEFDGRHVSLPAAIASAVRAYIDSGLIAATHDYANDGLQLPQTIAALANAFFAAANFGVYGYPYLTAAAADLIRAHACDQQKSRWLPPLLAGRFFGTMALTEPGAGSALADLTTQAEPAADGSYRLKGSKIFISGGDHALSDNIVHLVLARIKGAPAGVKGISLFICPKFLLDADGNPATRNDVQLGGLFHKMGGRAHTSTHLIFGERDQCVAYLLGEANHGLKYMFHMMNEARIGVGTGAVAMGYAGYLYSLNYARERLQGRLPSNKDPLSAPVPIIQHADVRRLLLAQKAYVEGGLALSLYARQLLDDIATHPDANERTKSQQLLDLLTPVFKSWPSTFCLKANDHAIQILGGHGYINEHPLEQLYRDNRLNPIHEGTHGIQALDLLARKLMQHNGAALVLLREKILQTCAEAGGISALQAAANALQIALQSVETATAKVIEAMLQGEVDRGLANAALYLDAFGHLVVGWLWLSQGIVCARTLETAAPAQADFYRGKLQALLFFTRFELPQIEAWLKPVAALDDAAFAMRDAWF